MVLAVKVGESIGEAIRDAMLVVQSYGALNGVVADDVAVSEIFSDDTGTWFVFLGDVALIAVRIVRRRRLAGKIFKIGRARDLDLRAAELSVVQEQSGLCGTRRELAIGSVFKAGR